MFSADQLLATIPGHLPGGADLSFSPEFDAIALARRFDDPTLDQGEWRTMLKEADWDGVVHKCVDLLTHRSKDLRLAVWLTEAAAKKHQLRGLAEGMLVIAGLFDAFWDQGLLPASDGDDHEQRCGNLAWLLARVPSLLRDMPPALPADAHYCAQALAALERSADARLGRDSPGFATARDAVDAMLGAMPAAPAPAANWAANWAADRAADRAAHEGMAPAGAVPSRAEALAQLRAIAAYFRRTEPHSPVSYFADKAAAAGEQDLASFLRSVVKDPASMAHIEELLGMDRPG